MQPTPSTSVEPRADRLSGRTHTPTCRFCDARLTHTFVDLGMSPLANAYVESAEQDRMEAFYPLHVRVCDRCLLVQLEQLESPAAIFGDYAYFSSYSDSWLRHARSYTAQVADRFGLGPQSQVIEIGSNDGYLLQYFLEKGIPVLGIEPAINVAEAAQAKGIYTVVRFFSSELARELRAQGLRADLVVGNNVLAHVPALNDFVQGMKVILKPRGVITMEFPHVLRLMEGNQFDTIYHEHFSYFSFLTVEKIFASHGLVLFDVEELSTHGGSLRIFARHEEDDTKPVGDRVEALRAREIDEGFDRVERYLSFSEQVNATKRGLLKFLVEAKERGKSVVGYGAAAKGNTLLNFCGVRGDFIDYVVDRNPHKQGKLLPGTRIPIFAPDRISRTRPDYVLILPWNLKDEITEKMGHIRSWGGRFVVPIPEVTVL